MAQVAKEALNKQFGGKVRVRVGGILIHKDEILLLKHTGIGSDEYLWSPPGGGLEYNETAENNLIREFKEETNLDIEVKKLLFINEFIHDSIHAIELFFEVAYLGGDLKLGTDPEMGTNQILSEIAFFNVEKLEKEKKNRLHNMFHGINKPQEVLNLTGYFKFVINSIK